MITYKVKLLFDNKEVYDFWVRQLYVVRDCYNFVSELVFKNKTKLNLKEFHGKFYKLEREKFKELPAQMCVKVYK